MKKPVDMLTPEQFTALHSAHQTFITNISNLDKKDAMYYYMLFYPCTEYEKDIKSYGVEKETQIMHSFLNKIDTTCAYNKYMNKLKNDNLIMVTFREDSEPYKDHGSSKYALKILNYLPKMDVKRLENGEWNLKSNVNGFEVEGKMGTFNLAFGDCKTFDPFIEQ